MARATPHRRGVARSRQVESRARTKLLANINDGPVLLHIDLDFFKRGSGSAGRGGGPGGGYWHIYVDDSRAGNIFVNVIEAPLLGTHASIQIHVNQSWQGRGVGRVAYRLAAEASDHDTVSAHVGKSNLASRTAAEHAGYPIEDASGRELIMVWSPTRQTPVVGWLDLPWLELMARCRVDRRRR